MPRNGSGVYSVPVGTEGTPNTVIQSSKFNAFLADLVADLNAARPITAGGTGATTVQGARDNLGLGDVAVQDIVPITMGGTGAATASAALTALGGAPIASPAFTGTPSAPTPAFGDNTTKVATMAAIQAAIATAGQRANVVGKNAAWTVVVGDQGTLFSYTGTGHTATLPALSSVTDGMFFIFANDGTGNLTLARTSTDLIDGYSTSIIAPGQIAFLTKKNGAWQYVQRPVMTMVVRDQKSAGVDAGSAVAGSYNTRDLTTQVSNTIAGASLGSNQVTLQPGRYRVNAVTTAYAVNGVRARLYNVTAAATLLDSTTLYADAGTAVSVAPVIAGEFVLTAQAAIELQINVALGRATTGLGRAANVGTPEIYSVISIERVG